LSPISKSIRNETNQNYDKLSEEIMDFQFCMLAKSIINLSKDGMPCKFYTNTRLAINETKKI